MHDTGKNWLQFTSHEYAAKLPKWEYTADHLSGMVIDDDRIAKYLHKRKQGESDEAYNERKNIVDYTPHFQRACLTLGGMLWSVDYDARTRWTKEEGGEGLGDPKQEGTIMSRLWENADARGTNYPTVWKGATIDAIAYSSLFVLIEGVKRKDGNVIADPSVRILPPQSCPRPIYEDGRLISVKVKTSTETVLSQKEEAKKEDRYIIYNLDGFEVWREDDKKDPELISSNTYGGPDNPDFRYVDHDLRTPILPIFEVELPLRSDLGFIMSKKANAILNQENTLDFLLWVACFPKLFLDVKNKNGEFDKDMYDAGLDAIAKGNNVIAGAGNKYDAPPTAPAEVKSKILERKVRAFFTTFFQAYGDAASERTATEIRQDFRAGVEAFLILLGTTMDEAENGALWRLEQAHFPGRSELWGGAKVVRSTNFQPIDIDARIESLTRRYLPDGKVPVDMDTALEIVVKALESDGIAVNPERREKLQDQLQLVFDRESQSRSQLSDFGVAV